jgi:hypothetical protein
MNLRRFAAGGRYRIKPSDKEVGSQRLLQGLTCTIVSEHPVIASWVKIRLDPNDKTLDLDWSVYKGMLGALRQKEERKVPVRLS